MANRTFADNQEPAVEAEWFTEVNNLVHTIFNNPTIDDIGLATNGDFHIGPEASPALFLDVSANALFIGKNISTGWATLEIGEGRTGNGYSNIDLVGDATYTDYGLRLIRSSGGPDGESRLEHRGTGNLIIRANDAGSIRLQTNNTTALTVDSSQNIGIGIITPDTKLHVWDGNAGTVAADVNTVVTIENSTDTYLQFLSPDTTNQGIRFGDVGATAAGLIQYQHTANRLVFDTSDTIDFRRNNSNVMQLTSTENVTIHKNLFVGPSPVFGTSASRVLAIQQGTPPTTSPAGIIQIYSKDSSDGTANATLGLRTEQAVEAIGTFTPSHKLKLWINGVEYSIQLDAV